MVAVSHVASLRAVIRRVIARRTIAAIIPLMDTVSVSCYVHVEVNVQFYTYILPIRNTSERPSFWLLETLRSQTTGSGSTSITRSVATFGTLMPCQ